MIENQKEYDYLFDVRLTLDIKYSVICLCERNNKPYFENELYPVLLAASNYYRDL